MQSDTQFALRGMTWDHPRGFDPLVGCARLWHERTGIEVSWERRSLQDFESFPIKTLAQQYDLIVIDHPHVGQITREQCLAPLDGVVRGNERFALARDSVGASFESYVWEGRLWALPIDAAAQVQAWRPDRISAPPTQWAAMLELARQGLVQCPMRPPHNLMTFYTLCGLLGHPGQDTGPQLIDPHTGAQAYELMRELLAYLDPSCFTMDPIAVFEVMAQESASIACVPLIYGYVSYAREGFRPARIAFTDIPVLSDGAAPVGSALGGTGIAVSAFASRPEAAVDFAYWVASAAVQRGLYAASGGQPGNAAAWTDSAVNDPVFDFYTNTRATLENAWVRPRHDGYMRFQEAASQRLLTALRAREPADAAVAALNRLFCESFHYAE
jgi:multiple sugar transport system substrate-binding protein